MQHVLIVDDDSALRQLMRLTLTFEGYDIEEAYDGAVALNILYETPYPMVTLLDWQMPRMDGEHVLAAVAADPTLASRHAYVLVTSNAAMLSESFTNLLAELCVPVLSKPFDIGELLRVVAQASERIAPFAEMGLDTSQASASM